MCNVSVAKQGCCSVSNWLHLENDHELQQYHRPVSQISLREKKTELCTTRLITCAIRWNGLIMWKIANYVQNYTYACAWHNGIISWSSGETMSWHVQAEWIITTNCLLLSKITVASCVGVPSTTTMTTHSNKLASLHWSTSPLCCCSTCLLSGQLY